MTDRPFSLQDLEPGDHLCCIYETEQEHRAVLTPFLTDGLHTGEKVLYIVDAHTAETVMKYLRDEGADADRYVAKGQLSILTSDAAYMQTGVFDPQGMISLLQAETEAALAEGYSALRVTGEMTWALRGLPGSERLIEYETLLNDFLPSSRCLAICQYDARRFTPDVLLNVLRTHPIAVVGTAIYDNFYYVSPAELLSDGQPTAELRHWIQNLAERKQGDEALRESEELYRQVFEQSPVGIGIASLDGGIIMASKAMQDITGYSADELLKINLADTYESGQAREALLEAISKDGAVHDYPVRLKRKDGSLYDALLSMSPIKLGGTDFLHTVCEDVTERKKAAQLLERAKNEWETTFDAIRDWVCLVDPESRRVLRTNRAGVEIGGLPVDELNGQTCCKLLHGSEVPLPGCPVQKMLETHQRETIEIQVPETDRWFSITVDPVLDDHGDVAAVVHIARDITERKRAEEALQESEKRYRTLFENMAQGTFYQRADGVLVDANLAVLEMFGLSSDQFLGRTSMDPRWKVIHEDGSDFPGEQHPSMEALRTGKSVRDAVAGVFNPRKEDYVWLSINAIPQFKAGEDKPYQVFVTLHDITERKRAEELLCTQRDLALALSAAAGLEETLPLCLDAAIEISDMDCGGVYLVEEASGALNLAADKGLSAEFVQAVSRCEADSANARLVMAGNPVYTPVQGLAVPFREAGRREGLRAMAVIPVRQEGTVIACINVASHALQEVPTFLRSGLEATAAQMANAIARARAEEEIRRQNKELEALNAVAATLSSSLNLREILNSALNEALEILAVEAGGIYLVDETSRRLTLMAHHGVSEEFVSQVGELAVDEETIARANEMGKAGKLILAAELLLKDRALLKAATTAIGREKLRSYLQAIIRSKGTPAGLLVVASRDGREFTAREEQLLSTIAHQIGLVVENVSLYEEQVNRVFQMDALRKTTLEITSQLDLDVLLHSIASRAIQLLNGTAGGLYLYRPEQDVLEWAVAIGDAMAPVGTMLRPGEGLAGKVWETGQSLVVDDYHHWEGRAAVYEAHPLTAVVGAPVRWGATVLGVLCVNALTPRAFSQADANLLSLFASQAAIAIQNARLHEEQQRRAREMTALYETSLDITGRLALPDVLRSIVNRGVELLHSAGGAVWLYRPGEDELELAVDCGTPKSYVGGRLKVGEGVSGEVFATRHAMAVEDYRQWEGRLRTFESDFIGGMLGVPLMWGEQAIGVLNVNEVEKPRKFTAEEVRLLTLFANQAAVAIQNARLHAEQERRAEEMAALYETSLEISGRLALTDVLRSIMNRGVELLHTAGGALWLYRPGEGELELAVDYGNPETYVGGRMKVGEGVSGKVFATRQAMAVEDYRQWEGRSQKYDSDIIGGMLGVPLMWGQHAIGVLNVSEMEKPRRFTEEEIRLLTLFANQAAVAIQNARLLDETRRRETQLAALHDVSLEIASELDLPVLLKTVAQRAIHLLGGPGGGLYLYRPERQELERVVHLGSEREYLGTTLRLGEGACGRAAQTGQPLVVLDYANWEGRSVTFQDEDTFNILAVPIKHGDSLLGALYVNDSGLKREFDEADIRLATMFANQAAIAIENARLHQQQQQRAQELAALHETALDITRHLDLDSLLAAVVARATKLLSGTTGELYLYRPDLDDLKGVASVGLPSELQGVSLKVGEGLSGKVFETGEPLAVEDYEAWAGRSAQYAGYGFSRLLSAPLRYETHSVGALDVGRPADAPPFTEGDTNLLTHFADQAAIAIENAQLLDAVATHEEDLRGLSSRLIDAQEQERKRIAQELHDEMGQALTAMSINLSAIDKQLGAALDPETAERLAETDSLITRTLEQMRELALDLRPSMLDDLGLLPALRWYVKRYENRTGILVGLETVGLEVRFPEQIETAIYRVVQEALTNVARHSGASRVDIRLQRRDSIVQAFIEDDGSGFDPAAVADREAQERGVGLVGMRERIAAVGGSLEIKSHPGKGTRLAIELPLP